MCGGKQVYFRLHACVVRGKMVMDTPEIKRQGDKHRFSPFEKLGV